MTLYLNLNGTTDYLKMPSMSYTKIIMNVTVGTLSSYQYLYNDNKSQMVRQNPGTSMYITSGFSLTSSGTAITTLTSNATYSDLEIGTTATSPATCSLFASTSGGSPLGAKVYDIQFYNGATLVAHYDMSTGTVQDVSGNGNHATLTGGTWADDNPANNVVLSMNGVSDYAQENTFNANLNNNVFTVEAVITPTTTTGYKSVFSSRSSNGGYVLYQDSSNKWSFWLWSGSTWTQVQQYTGNIVPNTRYQIVGTYDGTTANLYINGAQVRGANTSFVPNTTIPFRIGAVSDSLNYFFKGYIYNIRVYNRALSPTEISNNYNGSIATSGLQASYDMSTGTVKDQSGNGNDATLTGGTWIEESTGGGGGTTVSGSTSSKSSANANVTVAKTVSYTGMSSSGSITSIAVVKPISTSVTSHSSVTANEGAITTIEANIASGSRVIANVAVNHPISVTSASSSKSTANVAMSKPVIAKAISTSNGTTTTSVTRPVNTSLKSSSIANSNVSVSSQISANIVSSSSTKSANVGGGSAVGGKVASNSKVTANISVSKPISAKYVSSSSKISNVSLAIVIGGNTTSNSKETANGITSKPVSGTFTSHSAMLSANVGGGTAVGSKIVSGSKSITNTTVLKAISTKEVSYSTSTSNTAISKIVGGGTISNSKETTNVKNTKAVSANVTSASNVYLSNVGGGTFVTGNSKGMSKSTANVSVSRPISASAKSTSNTLPNTSVHKEVGSMITTYSKNSANIGVDTVVGSTTISYSKEAATYSNITYVSGKVTGLSEEHNNIDIYTGISSKRTGTSSGSAVAVAVKPSSGVESSRSKAIANVSVHVPNTVHQTINITVLLTTSLDIELSI